MSTDARFWGVIPAAGIGRRMGGAVPKQYLLLGDRSILDHSLERLLDCPLVQGICVALAEADGWWPTCRGAVASRVFPVTGGAERAHSVLNALGYLEQIAAPSDWVLVHDAVRPCLRRSDIDKLIALLKDHPVGGILGVPVLDTVKQADLAGTVIATVPRERLWRAFTPQMFRLGPSSPLWKGQWIAAIW